MDFILQDEEYREALARRLKRVRASLGETQEVFSRRLGLTKLTLHKYETGKTTSACDVLARLAAQGQDPAYVAFGTPALSSDAQRAQFAVVHSWVANDLKARLKDVEPAQVMEAAWQVFVRLIERSDGLSELASIDQVMKEVLTRELLREKTDENE